MGFTAAMRTAILDKCFRGTDFTGMTTPYLSLHTAEPSDAGSNEVTGGSYARQPCAFDAASNGACSVTDVESFTGMPACTVTHWGIFDALAGTFKFWGVVSPSKIVGAGDTLTFNDGDLDVTTS